MQVDQLITIPLKETRETASNEPTEAVAAMQVASPDKHVPTGKGSEDGATETVLVTEGLSETWLIERTYHAQLRNGRELSVPDFTQAMKQTLDISVPISTWKEISPEEASTLSQQGSPILLYGEHAWKHPKGAIRTWMPNRNMRRIIYEDACTQPEAVSGTEYAVCYLDPKRGTFSNAAWRAWFSSDTAALLDGSAESTTTFLAPCVQFPYTTHYTVMASDRHIYEYTDRARAIQGFQAFPPQEVGEENDLHTVFPQFCYYHEVTCPSGVYRLEFFGPRMDERGYHIKEAAESGRERTPEAIV